MGWDSSLRGSEFESQCHIQDGSIFTFIYGKNVHIYCLKRAKYMKMEARDGTLWNFLFSAQTWMARALRQANAPTKVALLLETAHQGKILPLTYLYLKCVHVPVNNFRQVSMARWSYQSTLWWPNLLWNFFYFTVSCIPNIKVYFWERMLVQLESLSVKFTLKLLNIWNVCLAF